MRALARIVLGALALTLLIGGTATGADYLTGTDLPSHVQQGTLDEEFEPLPGEPRLDQQAFLLSLEGILDRPEPKLLEIYAGTCTLLDGGYAPEQIALFHEHQTGLTRRQALAVTITSQEFCPGWGSLDA